MTAPTAPDSRGPVRRYLPSIVVFALLGLVAWWGHHSGWKAPKISELFASSSKKAKEDWCESHNVPDSRCIACHPELGGGNPKDWCKEHGVAESKCTTCHPEILKGGKAADWCREHGVPESGCTTCHPEIAVKGTAPQGSGAKVTLAPDAKPVSTPMTCQSHALRVQFASPESVRKAGIKLEGVEERPVAARLRAPATVGYDPTRVARLSVRVPGTAWRVDREVGQRVKKGDLLALVDSAEIGRAKAEFLLALAAVDVKDKAQKRVEISSKEGFRTQAELEEARAAHREAKIRQIAAHQALVNLGLPIRMQDVDGQPEEKLAERLKFLGLPEDVRASLAGEFATGNLIPVTSPIDGVVVSREVVAGEVVDPSKTLFVVADTSRMWVQADVRLEDARTVKVGQPVLFRPDGDSEEVGAGKITWMSTAVDEKTRTLRVRAEIENPEGALRAHTFGSARITLRESEKAVAVPSEAVQWEGCCHVVFVRLTDEVFQTRKVRIGAKSGGLTEILIGVLPGEVVVTSGSHVLKSDILKSKLGAGCTDD